MRAIALAWLALVACKDEPATKRTKQIVQYAPDVPSPTATEAECDAASEGGMADPTGMPSDLRPTRVELIRTRCREDRWSAKAASCYAKAADGFEAWHCELHPEAQW